MYFVYVDWTTESHPRPFYVGKGNERRIKNKHRNWSHTHVRRTFGFHREIIISTRDETFAFEQEKYYIGVYHTFVDDPFYNGIGCNHSEGKHEGCTPSATVRLKISQTRKSRNIAPWNKGRRGFWSMTAEQRHRVSKSRKEFFADGGQHPRSGKIVSDAVKQKIRATLTGRRLSEETRRKIRNNWRSKSPETLAQHSEKTKKRFQDQPLLNNHREKIRSAAIGRKLTPEAKEKMKRAGAKAKPHGKSVHVVQMKINGEEIRRFSSMAEASRQGGFHKSMISDCCLGKRKQYRGFRWKFAD